ncbi:MAG: hypothetical protein IJ923_07015, partial [Campylobacter sp.]|nr:hypothetical protein [Campylobacter sp.]
PSINENLKLAVGPYFGYSILKVKDNVDPDSTSENGWILGGKVGAIVDTGVGEFEAGVKADKAWHKGKNDWVDMDKTTVGLYLGYNFKF